MAKVQEPRKPDDYSRRQELKYLYELRLLNHDNLNKFVGLVCNERDTTNTGKAPFYVIYSMVEKASLEVDSIRLSERVFRTS